MRDKGEIPIMRDHRDAFWDAVKAGRLSVNPLDRNHIGRYRYLGTYEDEGRDVFKHKVTGEYLK